jgi:dienelactone hydrolase
VAGDSAEGAAVVAQETEARWRNFSPWYQWVSRLNQTDQVDPLPDGGGEQFESWRVRCRARLESMLGPSPVRVPLDLEVTESVAEEGYRRDRVVFDTEDTMAVPAYLLVPDDRQAPGPAVLAVHGHGPGKGLVCGLDTTEAPNGDYARQLARRGFVVLAPDLRCFGERADWSPPDHYRCDTNLVHATMAGWSPLTQNLWDLARCLDVLQDHPLVDPARIGVAGLSYGGTLSLFLAAVDERVTAAVVSGYFSSWAEAHKMPFNMCGSQVLPGMLGQLEHVDLGALVSPRPLLIETGTDDPLFPLASATESVARLWPVYDALGAPDALVHDVFEGDHQWHGDLAYPFLERWLGAGSSA